MGVARDCHGIMANDHIHKAIAIIFSTGRGQNLLTLQENFSDHFGDFLR
jgi:phage baseplate assembly protein W